MTLNSSDGSTIDKSESDLLLQHCLLMFCEHTSSLSSLVQELDIQDLQQQLLARDTDFEELQQQWNLQNFKFCLLVDMVSGLWSL